MTMNLRDMHRRQLSVLAYVAEHPNCKTSELIPLAGDRHTAHNVLETLYIRGFVAWQRQLGNARDWFWVATDVGHDAVERRPWSR